MNDYERALGRTMRKQRGSRYVNRYADEREAVRKACETFDVFMALYTFAARLHGYGVWALTHDEITIEAPAAKGLTFIEPDFSGAEIRIAGQLARKWPTSGK